MKTIVLFGAGNVATHLFSALSKAENFEVIQVYNHRKKSLEHFQDLVPTTTDFTEVFPADIYLLALKDEAIPLLAEKMKGQKAMMVHTSGATPLSVFKEFDNKGIFYPLQSFTKNKPVDFKHIPICLEAGSEEQLNILEQLGSEISHNIYRISSKQRKTLHVAAVFVNNFVNHLYLQGEEICEAANVPFEILHPLILETASKAIQMNPGEAQTGPAKRGDQKVIEDHLSLLDEHLQKTYMILTQSIQQFHGKKL